MTSHADTSVATALRVSRYTGSAHGLQCHTAAGTFPKCSETADSSVNFVRKETHEKNAFQTKFYQVWKKFLTVFTLLRQNQKKKHIYQMQVLGDRSRE